MACINFGPNVSSLRGALHYDNYIDIVNAMFDSWTFTTGTSEAQ